MEVIGVDLGGTNVRAAAVSENGAIVGRRVEKPSRAKDGAAACIGALCEVIAEAREGHDAKAVGIAIPGHIDALNGMVHWAPNFGETVDGVFRHWKHVSITGPVVDSVGLPVHIGNDANLAALGEYLFGIGKRSANGLVLFTLGTGIGSGVVLSPGCLHGATGGNSLVLVGNKGGAVELGHHVIVADGELCGCGARGCLEAYCGSAGLERIAGLERSAKELHDLADSGDEAAREAWRRYGHYLGVGIGNAVNTFSPEIIALGGQIAKAHEWFLPEALRVAEQNAIFSIFENVQIVLAEALEDAGILGAAALAMEAEA